MVISSARHMSRKLREKFIVFMEDFFKTANIDEIVKVEKETSHPGLGWESFLPTVKVIFSSPKNAPTPHGVFSRRFDPEARLLEHLQDVSFETILFALEAMISRDSEVARKKLLEEKVLSYTLCIPANVSSRLLPRAKRVVTMLRGGVKVPLLIPKLSLMARARLAKIHFGLKRVMDRSVDDIKLEIKPTPASIAPKPHDAPSFPENKSLLYIIAIQ